MNKKVELKARPKSWKTDLVLRGQKDPIWWITNILGDTLWDKQKEICMSILKHERTAVGACYSDDTEILTETRGFQLFKDLKYTDKVASQQDGYLFFVKPIQFFEFDWKGELVGYQDKELDFLVTPNHKCYVKEKKQDDFVLKQAEDCYQKSLIFSKGGQSFFGKSQYDWNLADYEIFGLWLGDGSFSFDDTILLFNKLNTKRVASAIQFVEDGEEFTAWMLDIPSRKQYVDNILKQTHFTFLPNEEESEYQLGLKSTVLNEWFMSNFYQNDRKRVPQWVKDLKWDYLNAFFRGFLFANAAMRVAYSYCTVGKYLILFDEDDLAEDFYEIGVRLGWSVVKRVKNGSIALEFGEKSASLVAKAKKKKWYKQEYEGKVYCVQVPSGVIFVRRNGISHWSGNSFGVGKTFLSARIALWFLSCFKPAKVISTAPCYDDQTEIFTDKGWKFFKDLNRTEKVATLVNGVTKFTTPSDWIVHSTVGDLIGYHSPDLDFVVTPHHKLYVKLENADQYKLIPARDVFGLSNVEFSRHVVKEDGTGLFYDPSAPCSVLSKERCWTKEHYHGKVFCVTVPSGIILVRRNGIYHWSGNTLRQVKDLLWKELRTAYQKAKYPLGGELLQLSLTFTDEHFGIGFSTDETNVDKFTGYHSPNQLVIFDQAAGISAPIWEAAEGLMTSDNCKWLAISNTTISDSELANICMPERKTRFGKWNIIKIRASESPNVVAGRNIFPGLIAHDWVKKREEAWGKDDPLYKIFVEAEFVPNAQMSVIQYRFMVDAFNTVGELGANIEIGVDVARHGLDSTVFVARSGSRVLEIYRLTGNDTMEVTGALVEFRRSVEERYELPVLSIKIDVIGVGAGVYDRGMELELENGFPLIPVNNAEKPLVDADRYLNMRAELAWSFRRKMEQGLIGLAKITVNDFEIKNYLKQDITAIKYKISSNGKIQLWSKEDIKMELGRSPDYWDALVLSFETPGGEPGVSFLEGAAKRVEEKLMSDAEWNAFLGNVVSVDDISFKPLSWYD